MRRQPTRTVQLLPSIRQMQRTQELLERTENPFFQLGKKRKKGRKSILRRKKAKGRIGRKSLINRQF